MTKITLYWMVLLLLSGCGQSVDESSGETAYDNLSLSRNDGAYQLLAVNDLGMHCADLDYQVFSILPPFNVLHAQVIKKGRVPEILSNTLIDVTYQAVSNPNDPVLSGSADIPSLTSHSDNVSGIYRANFWLSSTELVPDGFDMAGSLISMGGLSYAPLYPGVQVSGLLGGDNLDFLCDKPDLQYACPSLLTAFEPLSNNSGLPVPNLEKLYPLDSSDSVLSVSQQSMPGETNQAQLFKSYVSDQSFFSEVDFGIHFGVHLTNRNWFAAEGIPILPIDDQGRSNAYPMMQVTAVNRTDNSKLAALDVVLPVASEADCHNCHVEPVDCLDNELPGTVQSNFCNGSAIEQTLFEVMTLDDNPPGETRLQQLLNTAKINILRLHDAKHGALYRQWNEQKELQVTECKSTVDSESPNCLANQTPLQCSQCHYTTALDLIQSGPVDEPEQGAEGRQQTYHQTMSRVMHAFHGRQTVFADTVETKLFPDLPAPDHVDRALGPAVNDFEASVLNKTCYQCHPGKNTQCLRGAMASAGVLCQDCHGDMEQIGNDFSARVNTVRHGDFILDGSLRVPWVTEPGCQSCHTGDALNRNHPDGAIVASDGIRLLQAYTSKNVDVGLPSVLKTASVNRVPQSRFSENRVINKQGVEVDVLYRLSVDEHGGVMCEGCHNSTHAVWPNQNPFANDNVAAEQLQGHAGTLSECSSCHEGEDLGNTLAGPHGMHPVGGGRFTNGGHEYLFERNKSECQACHGINGEGTVLSRVFTDRSFSIEECEAGTLCPGSERENFTVHLTKNDQVTCSLCHRNYMTEKEHED